MMYGPHLDFLPSMTLTSGECVRISTYATS